jgi:HSP20 family protein
MNLPTPFNERPFVDFLTSIDSFFNKAFQNFQLGGSIRVSQYETKNHYIIEAELPGVKKEQIHLDVFSNQIKIGVHSTEIVEEKDDKLHIYKSSKSHKQAERIVMLPIHITKEDVKASYNDGLLTIKIKNNYRTIEIE